MDSSSCVTLILHGCIDSLALNYNPAANVDDGSCCGSTFAIPFGMQLGIDLDGEASGDGDWGNSVSITDDGNTIVVGYPNNDGNGESAGVVRVYNWDLSLIHI